MNENPSQSRIDRIESNRRPRARDLGASAKPRRNDRQNVHARIPPTRASVARRDRLARRGTSTGSIRGRDPTNPRARVRSTVHARERRRDRVKQKTCARLGRRDASRRRARARVCADDSFMTILARAPIHPRGPRARGGCWGLIDGSGLVKSPRKHPGTTRAIHSIRSFDSDRPRASIARLASLRAVELDLDRNGVREPPERSAARARGGDADGENE